jgi:hypothetical protein
LRWIKALLSEKLKNCRSSRVEGGGERGGVEIQLIADVLHAVSEVSVTRYRRCAGWMEDGWESMSKVE